MISVRTLIAREHGRRSMEYARVMDRAYALQVRPGHAIPVRRIAVKDTAPRHTLRAARNRRR